MVPTYRIPFGQRKPHGAATMHRDTHIEWPTVSLFALAYTLWAVAVIWLSAISLGLAIALASVAIAFHASLQHEVIHGHPFKSTFANHMLAWPPLTLVIPFLRFRDTHLAHHRDCELTDPFDDPETNFLDATSWERLPLFARAVLLANNTLGGRLILGPLVGTLMFLRFEARQMTTNRLVLRGWLWHLPAAIAVALIVALSPMPVWAYVIAAYLALSLLRIRTFLEHQAHDLARARSVIIEDRGPLALLFLNNNFHAVHHAHPGVPWYKLPSLYRRNRARFIALNQGYTFRSYGEVFRRYLFRRKDPVAHPLKGRG